MARGAFVDRPVDEGKSRCLTNVRQPTKVLNTLMEQGGSALSAHRIRTRPDGTTVLTRDQDDADTKPQVILQIGAIRLDVLSTQTITCASRVPETLARLGLANEAQEV